MKLSDVVLPDWVGVIGSALVVAVITAAAMPASSDELDHQRAKALAAESTSSTAASTRSDDSQP